MKKLLLIDGDEMLFKATAAVEHETKWNVVLGEVDWREPPIHVLTSSPSKAQQVFEEMIERFFERFETDNHFLCFSTTPDFNFEQDKQANFRFDVDPTYKNNRANSRKPLCYAMMRQWVETKYKCKNFVGLEADDVMGVLATMPRPKGAVQPIIISQDKDMQTIPTQVWRKGDLVTVTEEEADKFHLMQTLAGDITDGYPGCPGVGMVTAEAFVNEPYIATPYEHTMARGKRKGEVETRWREEPTADLWAGVVSLYAKAGLTEADALRQARLARILRWSDWDNKKKEPILWSPS
jgi:DNA polymerase-1